MAGKEQKTIVSFKVWDNEAEETKLCAVERYVITGDEDGPHVMVNAGSHGDEFLAIDTAKEVYERIDPDDVRGTISIIPEANIFSAIANKRETPVPEFEMYESEERNLNRCFDRPDLDGEPDGNITERLAWHLLKLCVKCDYLLDLHTGTAPGHKIDHIRGKNNPEFDNEVLRDQDRLIRASGLHYVIKAPMESIGAGVLAGVAPRYGVPAVTVEVGGGAYTDEELERYTTVVLNMLKEVDALPGEPETRDQEVYRGLYDVSAPTAGKFTAMKQPGDPIQKGEVLGKIQNDTGTHAVITPYDGLVESMHRKDWVNEGTRVSFIAIKKERNFLEAVKEAVERFFKSNRAKMRNNRR